tara:strand:- start:628 stop:1671 length:1044 start_codon:yes stop_codon:yes gene_type:complete
MLKLDTELTPIKATSPLRCRTIFTLLAYAATILIVPMLPGRSTMVENFDQARVNNFNASHAENVFIGNSLLDTRINPDLISELTGEKTVSLAIDGTAPGIWYLQLANVVAQAEKPPRQVFIFFHDDLITRPIYFTGIKDESLVNSLTKDIKDLEELPAKSTTMLEKFKDAFDKFYPLSNLPNRRSGDPVTWLAAEISGIENTYLSARSDAFFAASNLREQADLIQQPKFNGEFKVTVNDSFLPMFIDIANEINIALVLVRVAPRPNHDGTPNEPAKLAKYSNELQNYLAKHNIRYIDMNKIVETGFIDATMYYDGYHLKHRFRDQYTESFLMSTTNSSSSVYGSQTE